VASQDWPEVTKYAGLVCAQAHRQELIQDLYKTWQDPVRGTVSGGMIRYVNLTITSSETFQIFLFLFSSKQAHRYSPKLLSFHSLDIPLAYTVMLELVTFYSFREVLTLCLNSLTKKL
jgi:hypothetical protein